MFRFVKGLSPKIIKEIFQFREECYYQLRSRASLDIPRFFGPKIWKITPNELKQLQSLDVETKKLETNIIPL